MQNPRRCSRSISLFLKGGGKGTERMNEPSACRGSENVYAKNY